MLYLLTFAGGALVASLWWLLRMRRAALNWQETADDFMRSSDDADRMLKQQHKQILRLLKKLREVGHPGFQDPEFGEPARQNGRRKGAHAR